MGAVEILEAVDAGVGEVARFEISAGFELGVAVALAEIALDASVRKSPQRRPAIDRLDVAEIIAQHAEQLLHIF